MAKLLDEDLQVVLAGYWAPANAKNPYLWSSTHWEQWNLSRTASSMGHAVKDVERVTKHRGCTYRLANGFTFKGVYNGGEFGWRTSS